ncbi:MAG: hypothetical protein U9R69_03930, partial [Thermodesulfobacteriota bacterium]|nr:hypothetical protein [Thermodesulfobacteriota bacterium]
TLMGYQRQNSIMALNRLTLLLAAPNLLGWFNQSAFDFKYSNREFVLKLGDILNIPQSEVIAGVTAVNKEQVRIEKMFPAYIFIDTKFKRQGQPIFSLAFLEGVRHINISKYDVLQNKTAELQRIQHIVMQHYRENNGHLKLWGKIHRYLYVYDVKQRLAILPNGEIANDNGCQLQKASLTLKGKDICSVLGVN